MSMICFQSSIVIFYPCRKAVNNCMQLVDKKVLEELAKRQAVVEAEEFSYENFTALWRKTYDEVAE